MRPQILPDSLKRARTIMDNDSPMLLQKVIIKPIWIALKMHTHSFIRSVLFRPRRVVVGVDEPFVRARILCAKKERPMPRNRVGSVLARYPALWGLSPLRHICIVPLIQRPVDDRATRAIHLLRGLSLASQYPLQSSLHLRQHFYHSAPVKPPYKQRRYFFRTFTPQYYHLLSHKPPLFTTNINRINRFFPFGKFW